jgi:Uma2 family endonuclease
VNTVSSATTIWSEQEYLALSGNRLVEYSDGCIEELSMPTWTHQRIVRLLFELFNAVIKSRNLGELIFAPMAVRLWEGKFREPDLAFLSAARRGDIHEQYWAGDDLVVEVVSNDDRRRDLEIKRSEYARAGIPEYWIVDPQQREITVLRLSGGQYSVHGLFRAGEQATSVMLSGLAIDVLQVFAD